MTKMYLRFDGSVYLVQKEPEGTPFFVEEGEAVVVSFEEPKIVISLDFEDGICSVYAQGGKLRIDHVDEAGAQ